MVTELTSLEIYAMALKIQDFGELRRCKRWRQCACSQSPTSYYQIWITILSETFIIWCPRSLECPSPCIVERQSHCFIQPNTQSNCLSLSAVIHDIFSLHTFQQGVNVVAIFKTKMAGVIFFSSEKQYMYIDETLEHGCTVFNCVSKCADKQKATK